MIEAMIREMGGWMLATMEFKCLFLLDFLKDGVTAISCSNSTIHTPMALCWKPPLYGTLKLNFDGSSNGIPRPEGFGRVLRDHNKIICRVLCSPLAYCNSIKTKTLVMFLGFRELKKMCVFICAIEGDSAGVIG